jgi:hypothetical protein
LYCPFNVCTNVPGEGSSLRNSFRKLRPYSSESGAAGAGTAMINNNEEVAGIYLQTFAHHWAACQDRLQAYEPLRKHLSLVSRKPWSLSLGTLILSLDWKLIGDSGPIFLKNLIGLLSDSSGSDLREFA